jgi:hypothetical protein
MCVTSVSFKSLAFVATLFMLLLTVAHAQHPVREWLVVAK